MPELSAHIRTRNPSAIRVASIRFAGRTDGVRAINVAIGNVCLPMHPAMQRRLREMGGPESPFRDGVVQYTATVGTDECRNAFLNVIRASGCSTEGLHVQVTDGGSQAMELMIVACCGPAGTSERPLLLIDAAYPNYKSFAERLGRATVSLPRALEETGRFTLPEFETIRALVEATRPGALVVIPYDNPTGHFYDHETMVRLCRLAVEHDLWIVSDEAYRELYYIGGRPSSIWSVTEEEAPGLRGRRISIETASKVWNACGLRIGALVTDHEELHRRCVAENTAGLCSNALGQHVFAALAELDTVDLQEWFEKQRSYYRSMMQRFAEAVTELIPGVILGAPAASIYTVIDLRRVVGPEFDPLEFVLFCAEQGAVEMDGGRWTLLTAPMPEFYTTKPGVDNPGRTQLRIAFVEPPERMQKVAFLLAELLKQYRERLSALPAQHGY